MAKVECLEINLSGNAALVVSLGGDYAAFTLGGTAVIEASQAGAATFQIEVADCDSVSKEKTDLNPAHRGPIPPRMAKTGPKWSDSDVPSADTPAPGSVEAADCGATPENQDENKRRDPRLQGAV
jgi:hypothetical protein